MHTADRRITAKAHFLTLRVLLKRIINTAVSSTPKANTASHAQPAVPKVLTSLWNDQAMSRSLEE